VNVPPQPSLFIHIHCNVEWILVATCRPSACPQERQLSITVTSKSELGEIYAATQFA
jgi:hypothetical protein